tara:strand:+ start:14 stop:1126 length:1113 start_codon:yes stop_codon:yes gene_type:complete
MKLIKHSKPSIDKKDILKVVSSIETGWLAHGNNNNEFENNFKKKIGVKYAISCNSWTSGAFALLENLPKKGEIIIPSFTFVATANVVVNSGNIPVFCDIDYNTGNVTAEHIEKCISKNTIALMIVHFAGQTCEMNNILKLCSSNKILLIEDSAENLGGVYHSKYAGSFGTSIFSFFPSKNITTGEGGMITTNNKRIYNKLKFYIAHGVKKSKYKKWHRDAIMSGHNFRLTNFQAALGLSQLKKIDKLNNRRIKIAKIYDSGLRKIKEITILKNKKYIKNVYQMYFIKVDKKLRNKLIFYLNQYGIEASVHFDPPIHKQTFYKKYFKKVLKLSNTERLSSEIVTLPMYPDLKFIDQKKVIKKIHDFFNNNK